MSFRRLSPVFPVRNLGSAVAHYRKLGFIVREYEGSDAYAFAERDGVEIHLAQVDGLEPRRNMSAVYLYVDNADELYKEWTAAHIDGRLVAPSDTTYGMREGACLDADANLIRFGSASGLKTEDWRLSSPSPLRSVLPPPGSRR